MYCVSLFTVLNQNREIFYHYEECTNLAIKHQFAKYNIFLQNICEIHPGMNIYLEPKKVALTESFASHGKTERSMPRPINCSMASTQFTFKIK